MKISPLNIQLRHFIIPNLETFFVLSIINLGLYFQPFWVVVFEIKLTIVPKLSNGRPRQFLLMKENI